MIIRGGLLSLQRSKYKQDWANSGSAAGRLTETAAPAHERAQGYWPTRARTGDGGYMMLNNGYPAMLCTLSWVASTVLRHNRILDLARLLSCTARATASSDPLQRCRRFSTRLGRAACATPSGQWSWNTEDWCAVFRIVRSDLLWRAGRRKRFSFEVSDRAAPKINRLLEKVL